MATFTKTNPRAKFPQEFVGKPVRITFIRKIWNVHGEVIHQSEAFTDSVVKYIDEQYAHTNTRQIPHEDIVKIELW